MWVGIIQSTEDLNKMKRQRKIQLALCLTSWTGALVFSALRTYWTYIITCPGSWPPDSNWEIYHWLPSSQDFGPVLELHHWLSCVSSFQIIGFFSLRNCSNQFLISISISLRIRGHKRVGHNYLNNNKNTSIYMKINKRFEQALHETRYINDKLA